jgi:hypothetical protein
MPLIDQTRIGRRCGLGTQIGAPSHDIAQRLRQIYRWRAESSFLPRRELTPEQRSKIARAAPLKRWGKRQHSKKKK